MKNRFGFSAALAVVAGIALALPVSPASGFTLVERGGPGKLLFRTVIAIDRAMMCDGSHKLPAGRYDVEVSSFGDGSVRAKFMQGGAEQCTAVGRLRRGAPNVNAQQFHFEPRGRQEILEIGSPGMDQVLIGLLLPAVQLPAVQAPGTKAGAPR
jgi:hypothetical protein